MISIRSRIGALSFAAAVALATGAAPVFAQSTSVATPAEKYAVNPGGVDMRTGAYHYTHTDLAIGGSDESGGLALTRSQMSPWHRNQPFGNQSYNWDISLSLKRISLQSNNYQDGSGIDYQVSIHFGGRSKTFNSAQDQGGYDEVSQTDFAKLTVSGDRSTGTYTFTAADGTIAVFRPLSNVDCVLTTTGCGMISQVTEPDGTVFTFNYDYNASAPSTVDRARLKSIVSSRGYAMILEATPATGNLVTKACVINLTLMILPANGLCPSNAQATTTYTYVNFNGEKLASMTDPLGKVWSFTYAGTASSYTMAFTKPGQSTPWLTNTLSPAADEDNGGYEAVSAQNFSTGERYTYLWSTSPFVDLRTPQTTIAGGSYTDALNHTTTVEYGFPQVPGAKLCKDFDPCPPLNYGASNIAYQTTSGPVSITDPDGRIWTSDYCDPNEITIPPPTGGCLATLVQSFTDPEGIETDLTYDGARNIAQMVRHSKPGSGTPDVTTSAVYDTDHPKSSNKPVVSIDANGNETDFQYSLDNGGVVWEKDPAPAAGGVRPEKRYTYAQRYAWISNGAGGYVHAASPVWVLTQMALCKAGATNSTNSGCVNGASDEVITTYDYGPDAGPNNLILRGTVVDSGGLALRTCDTYDALGNKISETKPRAGLASCP
ncbi:MAG TPA: hypothetical protein VFW19_17170 [Allosphingosinicella sp.]|nr:hypothetical protein [Allosphingosinicella sp.]